MLFVLPNLLYSNTKCVRIVSWAHNQATVTFSFCQAAIDAPGGFLFEWWSVFWDIFIARTNEKHSEVAAAYIEVRFEKLYSVIS